ncbi:DUF3592 domain-containing protein [Cohaesibacter celericrescens]|nr:DUF3592 domain-containing protein [Cohaesibacter celericrescens]
MRYQPAYVYPGTQRLGRDPIETTTGWQFNRPRFHADQRKSVRLVRFMLVVLGLLLLIVGAAHFFTAHTAKGWEQVSATVTRADVVRMKYEDGTPVFTAKIEYQYTKNGQTFMGDRFSVQPIRSQSPGEVKRMISAYSVGRTVLAHVNPDRPEKTYLTANPESYLYSLIIPGLIMLALSLAIGQAIYMHAERKQRKAWRFGEFNGPVPNAA